MTRHQTRPERPTRSATRDALALALRGLSLAAATTVLMDARPRLRREWMEVSCVNPNQSAAPSQGWTTFTTGGGYGSTRARVARPARLCSACSEPTLALRSARGRPSSTRRRAGPRSPAGSFDATVSTDGYGADASGVVAAYSPDFEYNGNVFFQCAHGAEPCPNGAYDFQAA